MLLYNKKIHLVEVEQAQAEAWPVQKKLKGPYFGFSGFKKGQIFKNKKS